MKAAVLGRPVQAALVSALLGVPGGAASPNAEQARAFRSASTVQINVEQSGPVALPYADVARRLFEYAGVRAAGPEQTSDITLDVTAKGNARGASYSGAGVLFTGADVYGRIALRSRDQAPFIRDFRGEKSPGPFTTVGPDSTYSRESDAPFGLAFAASGSFVEAVVELVGEIYGEKAIVAASKDPAASVRRYAAVFLGRNPTTGAIETLIASLGDPDSNVRAPVASALARSRDPRARAALEAALRHPDPKRRSEAAYALEGAAGDTLETWISALRDSDYRVQTSAVGKLGDFRDPRAVDALISIVRDASRDRVLRAQAVESLGKIGDSRAIDPLISFFRTEFNHRDVAIEALKKIKDPRVVDVFVDLLAGPSGFLAAEVLGDLGDRRAVEPLILALSTAKNGLTRPIVEALDKLADPRAIEPLIRVIEDPRLCFCTSEAAAALAKLTGQFFGRDAARWRQWWEKRRSR